MNLRGSHYKGRSLSSECTSELEVGRWLTSARIQCWPTNRLPVTVSLIYRYILWTHARITRTVEVRNTDSFLMKYFISVPSVVSTSRALRTGPSRTVADHDHRDMSASPLRSTQPINSSAEMPVHVTHSFPLTSTYCIAMIVCIYSLFATTLAVVMCILAKLWAREV
ncbi:hypothetical protein EDD16DRAFT_72307 [Pisolithus croceorrhizus]|nr:hypothetical protein EDD16DRAFT_72307 [Pisolithus croceorrhizus]KAI6162918.1 hypothetical protein EDD17DRAFT_532300 [Pisolithus thermaeus]